MNFESTPIVVPRENVNDETVMLIAWLVSDGDRVEPGRSLAQVETSKAVLEIEASVAGFLRRTSCEGEEIAVGGLIGHIDARKIAPVTEIPPHLTPSNGSPRPAAPISRAIASPQSVDHTGGGDPGDPRPSSPPARFSRKARELLEQAGLAREAFEGFGLVRSKDLVRPPEGPEAGSTSPPTDETPTRRTFAELHPPNRAWHTEQAASPDQEDRGQLPSIGLQQHPFECRHRFLPYRRSAHRGERVRPVR